MMFNAFHGVVLTALVAQAQAGSLKVNNWCNTQLKVVLSHNGGCDYGSDGRCVSQGGQPWFLMPSTVTTFDWITDNQGTSVKISKSNQSNNGILQFEYTAATGQYGGIYWDLSDLDGKGNGLVGSPFGNDNVKLTPTGNGAGSGTCQKIKCSAGQVCLDSYQHPDDVNTRYCPLDSGDMWLDLCQPNDQFNSKRDLGSREFHRVAQAFSA